MGAAVIPERMRGADLHCLRDAGGKRTLCLMCNQIVGKDGECFCNPSYFPIQDRVFSAMRDLPTVVEAFYLAEHNRLPTAEEFDCLILESLARIRKQ